MTFEETKEILKKSIDTTNTMNQAIENVIQSIYSKGYNDAKREIALSGEYERAYERGKADAQPKTGHWIVNEHGSIYCSECGCGALYDKVYPGESVFGKAIRVKSTFCPTCGAKMVVPQESEEK